MKIPYAVECVLWIGVEAEVFGCKELEQKRDLVEDSNLDSV